MNYFDLINRLVSDEKTKRKRIDLKQDGNDSTFYNDRLETELVLRIEFNLGPATWPKENSGRSDQI